MAILVDDSDEKVLWVYGEVFDLAGFDRPKPNPQGCRAPERSVGSVLVVVRLVLAQRVPRTGLIPDQRAVQQATAKVLSTSHQNLAAKD